MNCKKNRKERLFCNAIHGIIESVDKVKDQKRTVFMEKIDHNAHSVYLMYYHLIMVVKYQLNENLNSGFGPNARVNSI